MKRFHDPGRLRPAPRRLVAVAANVLIAVLLVSGAIGGIPTRSTAGILPWFGKSSPSSAETAGKESRQDRTARKARDKQEARARHAAFGRGETRDEKQARRALEKAQLARDEARARAAGEPLEPYWPYRLGQLLVESDSLPAGEDVLHASLARDGSYAPALSLLSKLLFDAGRHDEAVPLLETARARGSLPDELLAGLALHYDALDQPERAREIVAALPASRATRSARVFVTLRGNFPDEATGEAKAAVDDDSKSAVHQNNFGITKLRAGDVPAARRAFLAAVDLDPALPGPYYNLAILERFYVFDTPAAQKWFESYWQRSHHDPDSLHSVLGTRAADELAKRGAAR